MSAAAVIIIIKPPRRSAMSGNQSFCDELDRSDDIAQYWAQTRESEPNGLEEALMNIVNAMCGNSACALASANDALWPLPT